MESPARFYGVGIKPAPNDQYWNLSCLSERISAESSADSQRYDLNGTPTGSGDNGLPLEIYAFTNTVVWLEYESIQADIFDHIFAIVEEFGLRLHQSPTGNDIRSLAGAFKQ